MDDEKYLKPNQRKLEKHFVIAVNGRRVKILNYKIYTHQDGLEEYQVIELITKIPNENLNYERVSLVIEKVDIIIEVTGVIRCRGYQPGLSRYMFKIESYNEVDKIIGS